MFECVFCLRHLEQMVRCISRICHAWFEIENHWPLWSFGLVAASARHLGTVADSRQAHGQRLRKEWHLEEKTWQFEMFEWAEFLIYSNNGRFVVSKRVSSRAIPTHTLLHCARWLANALKPRHWNQRLSLSVCLVNSSRMYSISEELCKLGHEAFLWLCSFACAAWKDRNGIIGLYFLSVLNLLKGWSCLDHQQGGHSGYI